MWTARRQLSATSAEVVVPAITHTRGNNQINLTNRLCELQNTPFLWVRKNFTLTQMHDRCRNTGVQGKYMYVYLLYQSPTEKAEEVFFLMHHDANRIKSAIVMQVELLKHLDTYTIIFLSFNFSLATTSPSGFYIPHQCKFLMVVNYGIFIQIDSVRIYVIYHVFYILGTKQ